MPCLTFSHIIPAFTSQNIVSLASLTVISLVYGLVRAAMAWMIRWFFWVPHQFSYGIVGYSLLVVELCTVRGGTCAALGNKQFAVPFTPFLL
jgi:hypothetical protein